MPIQTPNTSTAGINFVKVSLEVALTFCRLAQQSDQSHLPRYLSNAHMAYDAAVRSLFSLHLGDKEYRIIADTAQQVKLMLEVLQSRRDLLSTD